MRSFSGEALRFLMAGAVNTAATYAIYLMLLAISHYRIAYTAAYMIGVVLGYALNTFFVFRARWNWKRMLAYPLVYVLQYVAGLLCLTVLVEGHWVSKEVAPLAVVLVTLPLTFFASRYLIKGRPQ